MPATIYIILIPMLPLLGFVLFGIFGKNGFRSASGVLATLLIGISFLLSVYTAYGYFFMQGRTDGVYTALKPLQLTWLSFSPGLSIDLGILLDPISVMMLLVVTGVSLMVHVFSLSYMKGEERFPVYFAFLGLFTFSMLGLVLSSNIFQIYMFWELVGVSSFLLIGYYYDKPSAVAAAKKAFIVTRFADLGFLIGILVLSYHAQTLDFQTLIHRLTEPGSAQLTSATSATFLGISALTWGLCLVFMGGAGKSALMPLHIWLPDAMEGPTPVSALIHAATMVVAGVFLVARLFPVYAISAPIVLRMIAFVGVSTSLFAAIIACTQTDIKRVLAYSTMSQIGFMMFALGVSGYGGEDGLGFTASQFHLFTHALFKALLFLGAGVVIHHVHSNDMKDMGGLRKKLPVTHITFLIACLAIAGIPPFAGFFSKEEILMAAHQREPLVYWLAIVTSGLTAFYMFRLYFSIFWSRPFDEHHAHGHEGTFPLLAPLVILAVGAVGAGFIPFGHYVSSDGKVLELPMHIGFSVLPVSMALIGILIAYVLYQKENDRPAKIAASLNGLYRSAYHKFYFDELYTFITKDILFALVGRPAAWFDKNVVDGAVNLSASATQGVSDRIKGLQSGKVQQYAIYFLSGVVLLAVLLVYVWKR
jgi:NADH-quinone oxidoreductase subunit L